MADVKRVEILVGDTVHSTVRVPSRVLQDCEALRGQSKIQASNANVAGQFKIVFNWLRMYHDAGKFPEPAKSMHNRMDLVTVLSHFKLRASLLDELIRSYIEPALDASSPPAEQLELFTALCSSSIGKTRFSAAIKKLLTQLRPLLKSIPLLPDCIRLRVEDALELCSDPAPSRAERLAFLRDVFTQRIDKGAPLIAEQLTQLEDTLRHEPIAERLFLLPLASKIQHAHIPRLIQDVAVQISQVTAVPGNTQLLAAHVPLPLLDTIIDIVHRGARTRASEQSLYEILDVAHAHHPKSALQPLMDKLNVLYVTRVRARSNSSASDDATRQRSASPARFQPIMAGITSAPVPLVPGPASVPLTELENRVKDLETQLQLTPRSGLVASPVPVAATALASSVPTTLAPATQPSTNTAPSPPVADSAPTVSIQELGTSQQRLFTSRMLCDVDLYTAETWTQLPCSITVPPTQSQSQYARVSFGCNINNSESGAPWTAAVEVRLNGHAVVESRCVVQHGGTASQTVVVDVADKGAMTHWELWVYAGRAHTSVLGVKPMSCTFLQVFLER
eukprot:TRINITY_DN9754_c0_g1_i1.p1 TRINITY_DN9754_c0_g1~~TRINITY_DN9754_c0_g1_i1.p1  ORF type:complete len:570 (+),score=108.25 TRINITY_DN9754_c0_g1_i1:24-1712(+)